MDAVCRACLKVQKRFFNIFEHLRNNKLISDVLMEYTTVKIQKDDGLPINICCGCLDRLNSAYDFKAMVIESDTKLRSFHYNNEKEKLQNADTCSDLLPPKQENPDVKVEKLDMLDSKDKPTSVVQNNLPSNNESDNDNKCSNNGYLHQIEKNTDERKMEQKTLLKNALIADAVDNSNVINPYNPSVQNNEMIFVKNDFDDDLSTPDFGNFDREDENLMQVDSQENEEDKEISSTDNDIKHASSTQNVKTTLSKKEKDRKAVFCKECNRTFGFRYYFEVHIRHHTGDKPFKCAECGKGFAKQFQLNIHKAVHSDDRPFSCDVCGKAFKFLSGLQNHMVVHSEQKPYTCNQCNKMFKQENNLKIHLLRHQNDRNFVCEVCGKAFIDKTGLSSHMVAHKTEKNIACPTCGKCFPSKGRMTQHFKQHSDERPYACSYCDRRFNNKKILRNHVLIHTGEKPFTCTICSKSFRQSCVLTLHMRTHTGETPYPCKLCPCKFKYSHHLQNHMKVHNASEEK